MVRTDSNLQGDAERVRAIAWLKARYLGALLGAAEAWTIGSRNEDYWRSMGLRRLHRIPYTVPVPPGGSSEARDLRRRAGADEGCFVFAFVGRLVPEKGVEDLLSAFEVLHRERPATLLMIAGTGPLAVRAAAAPSGVVYLGPQPYATLGAVYAAAQCIVVPSRKEPWGLVVNESLLAGTPVIASDRVAAADDLVTPGTGSRFPAGDVTALTEAMRREMDRAGTVSFAEPNVAILMQERLEELRSSSVRGR